MPSLAEMVDEVVSLLHGFTTDVPAMGTLVGPIDATSSELALDFGDTPGASRPNGVVEIDNELLLITSYDASNGVAQVPSWGRGHMTSKAAAHAAGSKVTVRPRYPRARVAQLINQVVAASCPPLFAARDLAPIVTGADVGLGFPLPDDMQRVLRVDSTELGPEGLVDRQLLRNWTVRGVAGTKLLVLDPREAFRSVQVTIATDPGKLVNDTDDFATVTGLPESAADLVIFGTLARLALSGELARQQVTSVEAQTRNDKIQSGTGTTISRYYQALYSQRLEAERDHLQAQFPIQLLRRG